MASLDLLVVESTGKKVRKPSSAQTIDFLSVKVGASALEMKETTGHFDFSAKKLTNIASGGAAGEALSYTQRGAANGVASLDANSLIPITQIPPSALERLVIVADQAARFALTTATVQNGDTVKQTDTNVMYFVKDDANLGNAAGYEIYNAGTASSVAWSGVTGTPTTLAGYGITDYAAAAKAAAVADAISNGITDVAPSQNAVFDALALKANVADVGSAPHLAFTNDNALAITVNQIVYIKANGNVDLALASVALFSFELGLVKDASIASAASGNINVKNGEIISGFTGLTPGAKLYVSRSSAGGYTQSLAGFVAGESVYRIGRALSATQIVFDPEYEFEF